MDNKDNGGNKDSLSEILNGRKRDDMKDEISQKEEDVKTYETKQDLKFGTNDWDDNKDRKSKNRRDSSGRLADDNLKNALDEANNSEQLHDLDFEDLEEAPKPKKDKRAIEAEKKLKKNRETRNTVLRILLGIVVTGCVFFFGIKLGSSLYSAVMDYAGISSNEFQVEVTIPDNPTLDQVVEVLSENGVITNPDLFKKYVELKKEKKNIKSFVGGKFTLSSSMNYGTIIDTLLASQRKRTTVEVTITEGMTAYEIGQLLEKNQVCKASDFIKYYRDKMDVFDFEKRISVDPNKFNQMEGFLFPDKYEFYVCNELKDDPKTDADTSEEAEVAARKMYSNFNSKITKTMYKKMHEIGLDLNQFVALASMVQSEVSSIEDMKLVASVFLNRLKTGGEFSKLQSDVTVFYVQDYIEPYYKDYKLTTSLAVISNAYDTYECDGVPAGAICNPGLDAMNAVLDSTPSDYFYFCANKETGETYYAKTLEEHEANLVKAGLK